jgi:hypothetical protein
VTLVLKIAAAVVVVFLLVGTGLRIRKLRRDEMRLLSKPVDRRLVTPPPSPYAPSRGFRLLDESGEPIARPPVERPRLDPDRHYVFSDSQPADDVISSRLRHKDDWFLARSAERSPLAKWTRRILILLLVAAITLVVVTYYTDHHKAIPRGHATYGPGATTTSSSTTTTSTTTTLDTSPLVAASSGNGDATYVVSAPSYPVTVNGALGTTWAVYEMGPKNTLEWQGNVKQGSSKSLTMTGVSNVQIGSPSSATVYVGQRKVVFPSPLPATLTLFFKKTAG